MVKKVTDITARKKKEETLKIVSSAKPKKRRKKRKIRFSPPTAGRKFLIFGTIGLVLALVACYFTLSKAKIEVWPITNELDLTTKITVDTSVENPDFSAKVITGQFFEKEKTVTEVFPATGKILKEEKAEGTLRVYNEYSTSPQVLVATTRFVSAEGELFRTPTKVTIPGGHYEGGKLVPGEIDVSVVADQPGPEYNIDPTTFSIPGFAGTARYTKFYAKSFQPMTGGFREEVSQITREDLESAEDNLIKEAKEGSKNALEKELQSESYSLEYDFIEDAIQTEVMEIFSLATAGKEATDFNFQVKTESKTIIFKKEEVENFVKQFIDNQIAEDKKIYEKSLKIDYMPETINLDSGKLILSLDISAKIYSDVDLSVFKNGLKGKSLKEAEFFLENQSGITRVRVEFWPFWVMSVPEDLNKIEFKLSID